MIHRRLSRPLACTLGALLLVGCGNEGPVQVDVAPAATTDEIAPVGDEPAGEVPAAEETAATDGADATDPVTGTEQPPAGTSAQPSPLTPDPELIVDEDGCAADVATGIVVACHDPAAGPDED